MEGKVREKGWVNNHKKGWGEKMANEAGRATELGVWEGTRAVGRMRRSLRSVFKRLYCQGAGRRG